ncbi:MAG: DUF2141 domain-containing protein [bacterium]
MIFYFIRRKKFICGLILSLALPVYVAAKDFDVDIYIKNIKNQKGQLFIALHNNPSAFPSNQVEAIQTTKIILKDHQSQLNSKNELIHTFKHLSPGTYAIACYHDENNNAKLDTFLGIPKEGYAFSNNVRPKFKAPQFKEASFKVISQNTSLNLIMGY